MKSCLETIRSCLLTVMLMCFFVLTAWAMRQMAGITDTNGNLKSLPAGRKYIRLEEPSTRQVVTSVTSFPREEEGQAEDGVESFFVGNASDAAAAEERNHELRGKEYGIVTSFPREEEGQAEDGVESFFVGNASDAAAAEEVHNTSKEILVG